ncbi:MAG: hypothetical protein ACTSPB_23955, partial [Candidatus Thorarchaeota archaeon]
VERELELLQHDLTRLDKKRALLEQEKALGLDLKWASLDDLTERVDKVKEEIEGKESGLVSILDEQTQVQTGIAENEAETEELNRSLSNIQVEMGRIDAKIDEEERNLARLKGDSKQRVTELRELEKQVKSEKSRKQKLQDDIDRIVSTKETTMEQQRVLREEIQEIEDERSQIREELAAFAEWNTKRAEAYGKYKALQVEIEGKDLLLRSVRERVQIEEAELEAIESKWSNVWTIMEKSDEKELARRKGQLEREIASTNEERFRQSSLVSTLQKEIDDLNVRLSETSKRVPESVRELKDAIAEHKLESVTGPLIEVFSADDSVASAVESVLSDNLAMAFIVTEESDFQILQKLRDNADAPSPLILLRDTEQAADRPTLKSTTGIEGWLWDSFNVDPQTQLLLQRAIGDFVLTKTTKTATRLATKENLRAVSIDGHVIIPEDGKVTSNPKLVPSGMVSTAPLQNRLSRATKELTIARKRVTDVMTNLDTLTAQREEILDLLSQMTRWGGTWERRKKLLETIPEQQDRVVGLDDELKSLQADIGKAERNLRKLDNTQPPERSRLIGQDSALRIKHRRQQTELTRIDNRANAAERDEEFKRQDLKRIAESVEMLSSSLSELRKEIKESQNASSEILEKIEVLKESQEQTKNKRSTLLEDLTGLRDANRTLSSRMVELNLMVKERKLQVLQGKRQLTNMAYELENLQVELDGLVRPESVKPVDEVRNELVKVRHIL